jgi:expansin (peptidoglycan-binding protein)
MVVADSCDDGNAWCKDDPYHVDLAQASLNQFVLNGAPVGSMYPDHWNNRHVSWQFIPAPGYTGDISIGAIQGAQPYWPAIAISHLPNGIHGVQYYANGSWVSATMDSDMGDDYIIGPTTGAGTAGTQYEIQVTDASGNLINGGRVYSFTLPSGCANGCGAAYTPISYTTSTGPVTLPSPSPSSGSGPAR